jgi:hypothetical protein
MPSKKNPDWIKWITCAARQILLEDLEPEGFMFGKDHVSAEEAWLFYSTLPEFSLVVFTQFKARLKDHRTQANKHSQASQRDVRALAHDMAIYPRQRHNERGEAVFDLSAAKLLLREDVRNNIHSTMFPSVFQQTRPEYCVFLAMHLQAPNLPGSTQAEVPSLSGAEACWAPPSRQDIDVLERV